MAWLIFAWVVRKDSMAYLNRRLRYFVVITLLVAFGLGFVPMLEGELGLMPHSHCFLSRVKDEQGYPTLSIIINCMIALGFSCALVILFNTWTVYVLHREGRHLPLSTQLLQVGRKGRQQQKGGGVHRLPVLPVILYIMSHDPIPTRFGFSPSL